LNEGFGFRNVFALDRIDPKAKEASKGFFCGKEANVALHERNIAGEVEDGIARKMVGLELIEVKELAEKVRGRKAEAALEMRSKYHKLSGFGYEFQLIAWNPARYLCRYPPGAVQSVDVLLHHI
jgi:hypothetical protein